MPRFRPSRSLYAKGLKIYCTPQNAETLGRSGEIYHGVCPAKLDGPFRARYNAGRTKFLNAQVQTKSQSLREMDSDLAKAESKESNLSFQIGLLEQQHRASVGNTKGVAEAEPSQLRRLRSDLRQAKNETRQLKKHRQKLREELRELQAELEALS